MKKEHIMDAMDYIDAELVAQAGRPAARGGRRWVRGALIAACLCLALVGTAGAVTFVVRQASIQYMDREQFTEEYNEYLEEHGYSPSNYSDGQYIGIDFTGSDAEYLESWWQCPGGVLVEETAGTPEDGWTAKRVFKFRENRWNFPALHGKEYLETRYRAECASDYDSLWDGWDISWLEAHYTANPYGTFARTITRKDQVYFQALGGEYRGDGDAQFNITYSWDRDRARQDEIRVSGNKEFEELYTTPDGVELAIEMDTSDTGKSVFWVALYGDRSSFSMFGTEMALEDIHDILDSLNLSQMLEYTPE